MARAATRGLLITGSPMSLRAARSKRISASPSLLGRKASALMTMFALPSRLKRNAPETRGALPLPGGASATISLLTNGMLNDVKSARVTTFS